MSRIWVRLLILSVVGALLGNAPARGAVGTPIRLKVDATHAPDRHYEVHEVVPAAPGPLTLYYPKWIQGAHAPVGPINSFTGLKISASGKPIPWKRDGLDVFTFHLDVPAGVQELEISFDYLESGTGGGSVTDKLLVLNWYQVVLYPAGAPTAQIFVKATLQLPSGWKFGSALPVENHSGNEVVFQTATLGRLLDSPVVAGEYYRSIDLTPPGEPVHHEIDIVADSEAALAMSPEVQKGMTNLVAESGKIFGARHYREYHFLLTLSDHTPHFGVEHHESNDSRLPERVFLSPTGSVDAGGLLAHEFAHSWSGKFRRPKDISPSDFQTPLQTSMLWVYEGNTSYLGDLLAARSGLWRPEDYRGAGKLCSKSRTWTSGAYMAAAGGHGNGRGRHFFRRAKSDGMAELAAGPRLLRRRRVAVARSRNHHSRAEPRAEIARGFFPFVLRRGEQRSRVETVYVR